VEVGILEEFHKNWVEVYCNVIDVRLGFRVWESFRTMILVLGAHPEVDLEVRRSFRGHLAKVRNSKVSEKFDREWTLRYRGRIPISEVGVSP